MFQRIVNRDLEFPKEVVISEECRSMLVGLLNKYPHKRLGHNGSEEVLKHPWFNDMDWPALLEMKVLLLLCRSYPTIFRQ